MLEVTECPESGPDFKSVLRLSKLARATVGFMPDSAFRERAERGTLLVAIENGEVAGYVLYDLPRDEVRVRQLVTDRSVRGRGTARRLVNELANRHGSRRGIVLECRRDFPVNAMWPKLQFVPVGEKRGRSSRGLPLTIWFRDFGHPTLFSLIPDDPEQPIAALDVNIVIDLAKGEATTSERLTAEWMQSVVRLAITDHVFIEIDKQPDDGVRARHRRFASSLRHLRADVGRWGPLLGEMRSRIPNHRKFDDDLHHAARAAAAGARWLVTRDREFQRTCAQVVKAVADLDVVSPGELLLAADALARDDTYRPTDLRGSSLRLRDLAPGEFEAVAHAFVNQREGEHLSRLRHELDRAAAEVPGPRLRVLVDRDDYLGLLVSQGTTILELPICRVRRGAAQATIARQLVAVAREECAGSAAAAVRLVDAHCGEWIRRAATAEGYLPAGGAFTAVPVTGVGTWDQLAARVDAAVAALPDEAVPAEAAKVARSGIPTTAEDLFHPWRLTGAQLPTFVLSIEPAWAGELFDVDIARGSLFPRRRSLALQRENVYYRSPAATGGLTAPARLLWYVKAGPTHERGLRAVSSLRDVVVGVPTRLHRRFAHLGVYDQAQVHRASDGQRVMALRFSHTSMLPRPISLHEYREVMRAHGSGVTLQGPQRIPERVFDHVVSLGT